MPQTSAERGREVRRKLLTAAAELIGEIGWNAVTTRNLADRAGVRPGLIHYHFASLPALLREAALTAMRQILAATGPESAAGEPPAPPDPSTAIAGMLEALSDYSGNDPMSLLFIEAYLAATRDPELGAEMAALIDGYRGSVVEWLTAAGSPAPEATASVLLAALDGLMLHRALVRQPGATELAPVLTRLTRIDNQSEGDNR